jgi:superfamily II DNA helicase RecQ
VTCSSRFLPVLESMSYITRDRLDYFIFLNHRSLCYQFPAVYKEDGLSLVISPLLALIQDQVKALNDKQIVARTINSTLSQQEKKVVLGDLMQRQPTTRLLYITPELASTQSKIKENLFI